MTAKPYLPMMDDPGLEKASEEFDYMERLILAYLQDNRYLICGCEKAKAVRKSLKVLRAYFDQKIWGF